jgi:hypothetical protein
VVVSLSQSLLADLIQLAVPAFLTLLILEAIAGAGCMAIFMK